MNNIELQNLFLDILKSKFTEKAKLTNFLMNILLIEKEAVYRRLRGEVPFTFYEITVIAKSLLISIDDILSIGKTKHRPASITETDLLQCSDEDYVALDGFVKFINSAIDYSETEVGIAANMLPFPFYYKYEATSKLFLLKWAYNRYGNEYDRKMKFSDIVIPPKVRRLQLSTYYGMEYLTRTHLIIDNLIFQYLINDILYFHSVHIIEREHIQLIKQELLDFLNDMEQVCIKGYYPNSGNMINIYISNMNLDTNYIYMWIGQLKLTLIRAFIHNAATSSDEKMYNTCKNWVESLKNSSVLISQSGEIERVNFFDKQRKLIESSL